MSANERSLFNHLIYLEYPTSVQLKDHFDLHL
jgi:hypothetical protein